MLAPVSPAALTISTTNPDGPAALPNFKLKMAFFTISIIIGIGGPSNQIDVQDPTQILHREVFHSVQATPWLLDIVNF